jgi:nucleotide-binding universal stress UspA family protein
MSRRIVVGLDGSLYSRNATRLAIRRALVYNATLIGVAVVNQPRIEQLSYGAQPGAMYISNTSVATLLEQAKQHAQAAMDEFKKEVEEAGLISEDIIFNGDPVTALREEGKTADMLVTGLKTNFGVPNIRESDGTLQGLLKHPPCPILAVPERLDELPRNVIITYDGSLGSARALQSYIHVTPDLPEHYPVTILCIAEEYEEHKYQLEKAAAYLKAHGVQPNLIVRHGKPDEVIRIVARELTPSLVILGAPIFKNFAERLFGSVTEHIIKDGTIPVFVYH